MRRSTLGWLAVLVCCAGAGRRDVTGTVKRPDGSPVAKATVHVYTAAMKTGTSPSRPSCYADCGKRADTDAAGGFTLPAPADDLVFRLLVVGEGSKPTFVDKVDPAAGKPVAATVSQQPAVDEARAVRGRVLDPDGNPVVGAAVEPNGWTRAGRTTWGTPRGGEVDPLSVTNERGDFVLAVGEGVSQVEVKVEARGLATTNVPSLSPGGGGQEVRLTRGATVRGRLLDETGVPVKGVAIGLVQADRSVGVFTKPHTIGTDDQGRFAFWNVAPAGNYYVYGIMDSAGAVPAKRVVLPAGADGGDVDAGDLRRAAGRRVAGRLVLSDGAAVPAGTRILVSRRPAWDSQSVTVGRDGRFTVANLPTGERVRLTLRIKGYHLSGDNPNLSRTMPRGLEGAVDADIDDLTVVLDPGADDVADADLRPPAKNLTGGRRAAEGL